MGSGWGGERWWSQRKELSQFKRKTSPPLIHCVNLGHLFLFLSLNLLICKMGRIALLPPKAIVKILSSIHSVIRWQRLGTE